MDKKTEIEEKCDQAGCSSDKKDDKRRKKHIRLYMYEQWDCHPLPEFEDWLRTVEYPDMPKMDPITAWNSDYDRQNFYKWIAHGRPAPVPITESRAELKAKFHALVAKIGRKMPEIEQPTIEGAQPF
jgi:hypothetical protein